MGLVRFGAQTLNIEQVPDGHVIVTDSELANLRNVQNSYLTLKSSIPPGVDVTQIQSIVEKGQRYDGEAKLRADAEKKIGDLNISLQQYSNMPKEFSME